MYFILKTVVKIIHLGTDDTCSVKFAVSSTSRFKFVNQVSRFCGDLMHILTLPAMNEKTLF